MHPDRHRHRLSTVLASRSNLDVDKAVFLELTVNPLTLDEQTGVIANGLADLLLSLIGNRQQLLQRMLSRVPGSTRPPSHQQPTRVMKPQIQSQTTRPV